MANRSSFTSTLTRRDKQLVIMSSIRNGWSKNETHREFQSWANAHAHLKEVVRKRLSGKKDTEETTEG